MDDRIGKHSANGLRTTTASNGLRTTTASISVGGIEELLLSGVVLSLLYAIEE